MTPAALAWPSCSREFPPLDSFSRYLESRTVMDKLSIEILSLVVAELSVGPSPRPADRPRLARYATISRTWQHLVEARTFASIRYVKLDEKELSTFAALFKHTRRQTLLRSFSLSFEPPFEGNLRAGHIANSTALGSALMSLFRFLST